ncbi:sigma-54-dependent Fis family transcriptional regulator [candidate division KSB1 bacterium]|nr:sigma-54-dependent Fis family transcriptional regulator [candidate division KSB1 bacterium]
MREGMVQILKKLGVDVLQAQDGESGLKLLEGQTAELVVTDYRMAGLNGLQVLQKARAVDPAVQVMIITAYGSIDLAVQAMQEGATDFITKPFSHDEFRMRIKKILDDIRQNEKISRLSEENVYLRQELEQRFNFGEIIGSSAKMKALFRTLEKVAKTDSSVIIYGESGTGKELVARAIHKSSQRAERPFVRVNCGALAEGIIESELFGHEKGAFTGAIRQKKGRFELADSGTIFLDEIGDLPLTTQVKLLRVLQEHELERVGGEATIHVDVRIVAATNRDLEKLMDEKKFRSDLYYRLHIIPVYLPPLRERREDIPALGKYFLKRVGGEIGSPELSFSDDAIEALCTYHWPGNVRELENIVERCAVLAENDLICSSDIPLLQTKNPGGTVESDVYDLNNMLFRAEKSAIQRALKKASGVKAEAARLLGIKTSALYYKLEKFDLL